MIHELRAALLGISSYRALMEEPLMGSVRRLLDALVKNRGEEALEAYTDVFYRLRREAVKWDMKFPGRTPRGARQFLASLSAK